MIAYTVVFLALLLHWFGDFYLQNDKMSINKSSSIKWLSIHSGVYTCVLFLLGWKIALINGAAHWCIDGISSKITKHLWLKKDRHNFFVMIGVDQFLHLAILFYTLEKLF